MGVACARTPIPSIGLRGRRPRGPVGATSVRPGSSRAGTKQALLVGMLGRAEGATIARIVAATGWQPHTVRGAFAGALKKRLGVTIASEKVVGLGQVSIGEHAPRRGRGRRLCGSDREAPPRMQARAMPTAGGSCRCRRRRPGPGCGAGRGSRRRRGPGQGLVDRGAVEDELLDVLGQRQLGDGDLELGRTGLLLGELGGQMLASNGSRETSRTPRPTRSVGWGRRGGAEADQVQEVRPLTPPTRRAAGRAVRRRPAPGSPPASGARRGRCRRRRTGSRRPGR